jgi:HSP20 family protein
MRADNRNPFDDLVRRFFEPTSVGSSTWPQGGYDVPTDVFVADNQVVIRMDLPGVNPDDLEVTAQNHGIVVNGKRAFPWDPDKIRFLRRGLFYGDFTKRLELGEGFQLGALSARYDNGVLELTVPLAEEVKPKKVAIETANQAALSA